MEKTKGSRPTSHRTIVENLVTTKKEVEEALPRIIEARKAS